MLAMIFLPAVVRHHTFGFPIMLVGEIETTFIIEPHCTNVMGVNNQPKELNSDFFRLFNRGSDQRCAYADSAIKLINKN